MQSRNFVQSSRITMVCCLLFAGGLNDAIANEHDDLVVWANDQLTQFCEQHNLASVTGAAIVQGEIIWQGAAGFADVEAKRLATRDTPYRIASLTKSMTGVAVIKLVETKKIDLAATVQTYVPRFPKKKWPITIEQLLHHRSGIGHYKVFENRPTKHYATLTDALTVFQDRPLRFEPGTRYGYTTYGYTLLGAVIEGASETEYEAWMKENIWQPAGMTSTQLEHRDRPISGQASLYRLKRGELVSDAQTDLSVKGPGGGVVSTAPDLARFAHAVMSGKLLSEDSLKQLWKPPATDDGPPYAAGWFVDPDHELGYVVKNDGNQSGANSRLILLPDRQFALVLLCNVGRVGQPMKKLAGSLIEELVSRL
jgi:serine beta-lactamase-like protein LACTB